MINNIFKMLIELLNNDKVNANYLSEKLEVSIRTIYRYVDTLVNTNIPITTKIGKNGGIMLGSEYKINQTFLTDLEIQSIISGLEYLKYDQNISDVESLISKIASMRKSRSNNSKIDSKFVIEHTNSLSKIIGSKIEQFSIAIDNLLVVEIIYHNRNHDKTMRNIEPINFVLNDNEWYVYCFCRLKQDYRIFKLSRITNICITNEKFVKGDYEAKWRFDFENNFPTVSLVLKVFIKARYMVEEWLGIEALTKSSNGDYFIATTSTKLNDNLIYKLLSLGDGIEILEPTSVKNQIIEIIKNIIDNQKN